jgi:hypothetical protein
LVPVSRVLELTSALEEPGYPRLLVVAAQQALAKADHDSADELLRLLKECRRDCLPPAWFPAAFATGTSPSR